MQNGLVFILTALLLAPLSALHAAEPLLTPAVLWRDYDSNQGDLKEESVKQETRDGVSHCDSYLGVQLPGEEIRNYCRYSVKEGVAKAPGLPSAHVWMGAPNPDRTLWKKDAKGLAAGDAIRLRWNGGR